MIEVLNLISVEYILAHVCSWSMLNYLKIEESKYKIIYNIERIEKMLMEANSYIRPGRVLNQRHQIPHFMSRAFHSQGPNKYSWWHYWKLKLDKIIIHIIYLFSYFFFNIVFKSSEQSSNFISFPFV